MRFDYQRPATLSEAIDLLADSASAHRPIAFGSDLLIWAKSAAVRPESVIDLTGLEELRRLAPDESHLFIGAGVTIGELTRSRVLEERFPSLHQATTTMGSVQLREGASVGGNICTASPAGDTGPPLLCYGGVMVVASARGEREVPAERFFVGPGKTALEPDELLLGVKLPWTSQGAVGIYLKGARRAAVDLALVSVAAVAWPAPENPSGVDLRIALGAVAPTAIRAPEAEAIARERGLDEDPTSEISQSLASAVRSAARPINDVRATAAYRLELVGGLAARGASRLGQELKDRAEKPTEINR